MVLMLFSTLALAKSDQVFVICVLTFQPEAIRWRCLQQVNIFAKKGFLHHVLLHSLLNSVFSSVPQTVVLYHFYGFKCSQLGLIYSFWQYLELKGQIGCGTVKRQIKPMLFFLFRHYNQRPFAHGPSITAESLEAWWRFLYINHKFI